MWRHRVGKISKLLYWRGFFSFPKLTKQKFMTIGLPSYRGGGGGQFNPLALKLLAKQSPRRRVNNDHNYLSSDAHWVVVQQHQIPFVRLAWHGHLFLSGLEAIQFLLEIFAFQHKVRWAHVVSWRHDRHASDALSCQMVIRLHYSITFLERQRLLLRSLVFVDRHPASGSWSGQWRQEVPRPQRFKN